MQVKPYLHRVLWVSVFTSPAFPPPHPLASEPLLAQCTGLSPPCPALPVHSDLCARGASYPWSPLPGSPTTFQCLLSWLISFFSSMLPFIQVHSKDSARCFLKLGLPSLLGRLFPPFPAYTPCLNCREPGPCFL